MIMIPNLITTCFKTIPNISEMQSHFLKSNATINCSEIKQFGIVIPQMINLQLRKRGNDDEDI